MVSRCRSRQAQKIAIAKVFCHQRIGHVSGALALRVLVAHPEATRRAASAALACEQRACRALV